MRLNKKGFTLAELLIVVAIIAVLVAIAIPVFTTQLEKSRDSVSISNIRAAYAEASSSFLTANGKAVAKVNNVTVNAVADGKQTVVVENVAFKGQASGFSDMEKELSFTNNLGSGDASKGGEPGNYTLTFEFNTATGECTLKTPVKSGS